MTSPLSRHAKAFSAIPGPALYPILGTAHTYLWGPYQKTKYHQALRSMRKEFGPLVRQRVGGKTIVHVFDPEDIKTVYSQESKWPLVPPLQETTQMYRAQKQMSLGLGNTNGEEWYRLRTNSQQRMLRPKEVQQYLPTVNAIARDFADRIARVRYINREVNDLRSEVGRWSLENAGSLVFDRRLGVMEDDSPAEEWGRKMVDANATIFKLSGDLKLSLPFYKYLSTPKWRTLVRAEDSFYSEAISLVDDAILSLKAAVETEKITDSQFYFLSYLLSKEELSLKDVTVICLSLFSDGLSTTTPTVLFNLYALAANLDVQEKVFSEVQSVLEGTIDEDVTQDHINRMPYLKAFVKETFRMWPNGTEVSRFTEGDLVLGGYHVPEGTHVDLNPFVHFRDSGLFPDPDVHRPERWLRPQKAKPATSSQTDGDNAKKTVTDVLEESGAAEVEEEAETAKIHPYLLTPFGHGTRMCAGRRFAEQDLYVLLATLLRRYRLEYPVGESMDQVYHTLLFPDRPVRVKFFHRKEL